MQVDLEIGEIWEEPIVPCTNVIKSTAAAPPVLKSILKKTSLHPPQMLSTGVSLFADIVPDQALSASTTTKVVVVPGRMHLDESTRTMMPRTPASSSSSIVSARLATMVQNGEGKTNDKIMDAPSGWPAGGRGRGRGRFATLPAWMSSSTSFNSSAASFESDAVVPIATALLSASIPSQAKNKNNDSNAELIAGAPQRNPRPSAIKSYAIFVDDDPLPGSVRPSNDRTESSSHLDDARYVNKSRATESSSSSSTKKVIKAMGPFADTDQVVVKKRRHVSSKSSNNSSPHDANDTAPRSTGVSLTLERPPAFGPFAVYNGNGSEKQTIAISKPSSKRPSSVAHTTTSERAIAAAASSTMHKPRVSGQHSDKVASISGNSQSHSGAGNGAGASLSPPSQSFRARAFGPFSDDPVDNNISNFHGDAGRTEPGPSSNSRRSGKSGDPRLSIIQRPPRVDVMAGDNAEAVARNANATADIPTSSSSTSSVATTTLRLLGRPGIFNVDIKGAFPKILSAKVFKSEREANQHLLRRNVAASDGMTREAIERIINNEMICELMSFMTDDDKFEPEEGVVIDGERPLKFDKLLEINGESLFGRPVEYLMVEAFPREKKRLFKLGSEWTMSLKLLRLAPVVKTCVPAYLPPSSSTLSSHNDRSNRGADFSRGNTHDTTGDVANNGDNGAPTAVNIYEDGRGSVSSHHPTPTAESHDMRPTVSRGSDIERYYQKQQQQSAAAYDAAKPFPVSKSSGSGFGGMPPPSGLPGRITPAVIGSYNQGIQERGQTTGRGGGVDRFKDSLSNNIVGGRLSGIGLSICHDMSTYGIESSLTRKQQQIRDQKNLPTDTLLYELKRLLNSYGEASRKEVNIAVKDSLERRPERAVECMNKLFKKVVARKDQLPFRHYGGEDADLITFILKAIFGSDGVTIERHYCYSDVKAAVVSLRNSVVHPRPQQGTKAESAGKATGESNDGKGPFPASTSDEYGDRHFNGDDLNDRDDDVPGHMVQSAKKSVLHRQPSLASATQRKSLHPDIPSSLTHCNKPPLNHPAEEEESSSLSTDDEDDKQQRGSGFERKRARSRSYVPFADRVADLRVYVEKHQKLPSESRTSLYKFVQNQQYNKRDNKLSQKRIAMLESVPYFTWVAGAQKVNVDGVEKEELEEEESNCCGDGKESVKKLSVPFAIRVAELKEYTSKHKKLPPKSELSLYNFVRKQRREERAGKLILERFVMLESVPYFTWEGGGQRKSTEGDGDEEEGTVDDDIKQSAKTTFTDRVAELQAYTSKHKTLPPISELSLYRFYKRQQYNKRDNTLSDERVAMMENVPYFTWIGATTVATSTSSTHKCESKERASSSDDEEVDNFDDLVRKVKKFVRAYDGEFPAAMGFRPCEHELWQFLKMQRQLRRSGSLSAKRVPIMEGINNFTWEDEDGGPSSSPKKPHGSPIVQRWLPDTLQSPSPSSATKSPREEFSYEIDGNGDLVRRVSSRAHSSVLEPSSSFSVNRPRGEDTSVESVFSTKKTKNTRDGRWTANPCDSLARLTAVEVGSASRSTSRDFCMDVDDDDEEEDKNLVAVRRMREADRLAAEQAASALLRRRLFEDCQVWARQSANCVQFYPGTVKKINDEESSVCIRWDNGAFDWLQIHPTLIQLNDDISATSRRTRKLR